MLMLDFFNREIATYTDCLPNNGMVVQMPCNVFPLI